MIKTSERKKKSFLGLKNVIEI